MTTVPNFSTPVGLLSTIECFGDSLMSGSGGTIKLPGYITQAFPERIVRNNGIAGQTAERIAARQGGLAVAVTVTGNAFVTGMAATSITSISQNLLSTPSDSTARYISGSINKVPCVIERTTGDAYNLYSLYSTTAAIPAGSVFVPDDGQNARNAIQVLWLGRNNLPTVSGVPALVDSCVAYMGAPRRAIVIGILPARDETTGSGTNRTNIDAANAILATSYGTAFVPSTPPTVAEMAAIGYSPSGPDNTAIANGVFPPGMSADNVHLNDSGYQIIANRVTAKIKGFDW